MLPDKGIPFEILGRGINNRMSAEYALEIQGCAESIWRGKDGQDVQYGFLTIANI